jgi:molecular chaperone DnaJ
MQRLKPCPGCQGSGTDPNSPMSTCTSCGGSGRLNVAEGPIQFTKPCPHCHGHGQIGKACPICQGNGRVLATEKIKVAVPQGVREGSKVRVTGKGEPGVNGGPPGDLYLVIHIRAHPFLKREGDNLYMEVPVTISEAMAGATIAIPTIGGQVRVKVPPKSQSGQTLKLKGKGAFNPKTKQRGDLMVKLAVRVPQTDDKETLDAAEKMSRLYKTDLRGHIRL